MDEIINQIMNNEKWPDIEFPENLELLNEVADECFSTGTFSGKLSAILMYHQLIEAMCMHLLKDCHFLIQLSVHPATIKFKISENKMLGSCLCELKESVSFYKKDDFLDKVFAFNKVRNKVIHEMRKNNIEEVSNSLDGIKQLFDEIYELYDEIQDDFRVIFHGFKKDVFLDEYAEEE